MTQKKRKKGCIIGCASALAVLIAPIAFVPSLRRVIFPKHQKIDPECIGVVNAIEEVPYAHAYLPTINRGANTINFSATVDSQTDYIEEAGNVIRNINAYLSANPDAPEHQYDCRIIFSIEGTSMPSFLRCHNYDTPEGSSKKDRKPYFFKCVYDGSFGNPTDSEIRQLSGLDFLESLEMIYIIPENCPKLDSIRNLQTLRIQTHALVPKGIREHLKETHPGCRIFVNNMEL